MSNAITQFKIDQAVKSKLIEKMSLFSALKIMVVGDVGVDEYVTGSVKRISPEAPVPILEVTGEDKCLGLASNVAQNVVSLGGQVELVSVIGADAGAEILKKLSSESKLIRQ